MRIILDKSTIIYVICVTVPASRIVVGILRKTFMDTQVVEMQYLLF